MHSNQSWEKLFWGEVRSRLIAQLLSYDDLEHRRCDDPGKRRLIC